MNLYEVLKCEREATQQEIKNAYRHLARVHHPDKGGDVKEFQKIVEAYEVLSDPVKRARYDDTGEYHQVKPIEEEAAHHIILKFKMLLHQHNLEDLDYIQLVAKGVENDIQSLFGTRDEANSAISKLNNITKRFSIDSDYNIFECTLLAEVDRLNTVLDELAVQLELLETVRSILEDYTWEGIQRISNGYARFVIDTPGDWGNVT